MRLRKELTTLQHPHTIQVIIRMYRDIRNKQAGGKKKIIKLAVCAIKKDAAVQCGSVGPSSRIRQNSKPTVVFWSFQVHD